MNPSDLREVVEKLLPSGYTCDLMMIDHLYTLTITRESDKRQVWTYVAEDEHAAMIAESVRRALKRMGAKPKPQDDDAPDMPEDIAGE